VANGSTGNYLTDISGGHIIAPLLMPQGDEAGRSARVNPCYISGIECTLKRYLVNPSGSEVDKDNIRYTIKRNETGARDVTIPTKEPLYFATGKSLGGSLVTIIWIGTNDGEVTGEAYLDAMVERQKTAAKYVNNQKFIVVGLHLLANWTNATLAGYYENKLSQAFGNKFFNIRQYCSTNMIYDAGITPTADDLQKMSTGQCPSSLLIDGTHFNPSANNAIGTRLYSMISDLGYI